MTKTYEIDKITLGEAYYLNYFHDIEITVKNGNVIITKI